MEDDIDIYEDLPSFEARDCEKYKEEIRELSQKCSDFERENAELKLKVEELSKSNETLSMNLSSLLKTAKAEIGRKDKMIADLRQQHDNMAFRRGGHRKPQRPKPEANYPRYNYNNFDSGVGQENLPIASQPISRHESEDEVEEPEQKYEPEKIACTVFGERLRKKILLEQEAERIQKEEIKLMMLESQANAVQNKAEIITENETIGEIVKVEAREVVQASPVESIPSVKSSSHGLTDASLPSYEEEDDRSLSERRERVRKLLGSKTDRDTAHPKPKRRKTEDDRYHSDDTRHYNASVKHESRLEGKDNFRASGDVAKRLGHRRGSNNREEFTRGRCGDRSKSNYRSRSKSADRRHAETRGGHVEKRADRHRTDRYREYMDKYEKRRRSGEKKDYSGKLRKDDLRAKIEHRAAEPMIASKYDYGDYKSSKLDREEKRKSRSRSRGRIELSVDDKRTRLAKSSDKLANAAVGEESNRERKGVDTRSKDVKRKVGDRKDFAAEIKLERSSRSKSKNEKGNIKAESSALLGGSGNDSMNKQLDLSTRLTDGLLALPESNVTRERIKTQRKGSRRKSNDEAAEDRDRDHELKSQTAMASGSKKELTNKQIVTSAELPESSEKEVTNKLHVSSAQMSKGSKKEVTNNNHVLATQLPDSLALIAKSDETREETNSEENATNEQTESDAAPEEIEKQSKDASAESKNFEAMRLNEKDCDSEPTQTSRVSGTKDLSKKESTDISIVRKCQKDPGTESTTLTLPTECSEIEITDKLIFSKLENDTELPSTPTEIQLPSDAGSRSFREEKIENIEKFIKNYQDDENLCCRIADVDAEDPNGEEKFCNSTSSILDALSMDLEVVDITGTPEDDGNSSVNEQLLLESLSTPVKKNNPPLPPHPPPDETQQPPLPPVPPPDETDRPPLPPIPYPAEIKQQPLPPLPPSPEKDQPPLPPSSPAEKDQPPLPNTSSTPKKSELPPPPSPDEETKDGPSFSSSEGKQEPPLPSPDCDNEISPVTSSETKEKEKPKRETPNKNKSSSPSDEPQPAVEDENQPSPSPLSLDDKKENSPPLLSADEKKQISTTLPATDEKTDSPLASPAKGDTMESSLSKLPDSGETDGQPLPALPVPDGKVDAASPHVSASSEKNEKVGAASPQVSASSERNEKVDAALSQVPTTSEKNEKADTTSPQVPTPSEKNEKVDTISPQVSTPSEKNEKVDATSPQVLTPSEKNEKADTASPQVPTPSEKNEKADAASPQVPTPSEKNEKMDVASPQVPTPSEKNEKMDVALSQIATASEKNEKMDAASPQVPTPNEKNEKNDVASSQIATASEKNEKADAASPQVPTPSEKKEKVDAASPQVPTPNEKNEKNDVVSPQVPKPNEKNEKVDTTSSQVPTPSEKNEKVDAASPQVPTPSEKNEKVDTTSPQVPKPNEKNEKVDTTSSQVPTPSEKNEKVDAASTQAPAPNEINEKMDPHSLQVSAPNEKNTKPSSREKKTEKNSEIPETKEIPSAKSEPEKPRTEKATPKQITRCHKIPCVPIVSRYTRNRRNMVLTDSQAARCIVKSKSSIDTETNNNATIETRFSQVFKKEPKIVLKQVETHKFEDTRKAKACDTPDSAKPVSEKSEKIIEAAKNLTVENVEKIESKTSTEIKPREPVVIISSSEIVAATFNEDTNLHSALGKNASTPEEAEPEERAASPRMRKRSALKTIATPDPSGDSPGAQVSRKRTLPKEKENQSKQAEKRCKIMVVARRRRTVHLEDSSTAITLVSSAQDTKPEGSPKITLRNCSTSSEKSEVIAQSIPGSASKGRKGRSADK